MNHRPEDRRSESPDNEKHDHGDPKPHPHGRPPSADERANTPHCDQRRKGDEEVAGIDWVTLAIREERERSRRRGAPCPTDDDQIKELGAEPNAPAENGYPKKDAECSHDLL